MQWKCSNRVKQNNFENLQKLETKLRVGEDQYMFHATNEDNDYFCLRFDQRMRFHDYFLLQITATRTKDYIRFTVDTDTCFDYNKRLKSIRISNKRTHNCYLYFKK